MRKLLATAMIVIFSFCTFGQSFAIDDLTSDKAIYTTEALQYQTELNKTRAGKEYAALVDTIVEKYKNDTNYLYKLSNKLSSIDTSSLNDKNLMNMFNYLEAKINLTLAVQNEGYATDIINPSISSSDKSIVDAEVLDLQTKLIEKAELSLIDFSNELEKSINRRETGNMKINFLLDEDSFGYVNTNIELNNYEAVTNGFDSQTKGALKVFFQMLTNDNTEQIDIEIDSLVDIISKEGTIYMLLNNINLKEVDDRYRNQNLDSVKKYIDILQGYAAKNQYIKYEDATTQNIFNILKTVDYTKLGTDVKAIFNEPILEGYKKVDNKYYLRPTKSICDSAKKFMSKFDPFNGDSCSTSQYNSLLEDFNDLGKFYMIIGETETTFGFEGNIGYDIEENAGYITFTDSAITDFYYSIKPNQEEYPEEHFYIQLEDNKLTSSLMLTSSTYDYLSGEYLDTKFEFKMEGETDNNNELITLLATYKGTDENGNEFTSGKFEIEDTNYFDFSHKSEDYYSNVNITMNGGIDSNDMLNDLNFDMDISTRDYSWDSNWNIIYGENLKKVFDAKLAITNKKITGNANFYSDGNVAAKLTTDGNYAQDLFNLNTRLELGDELSNFLFGYTNVVGNFDIKIDMSNMKNNLYMLLGLMANGKAIIRYEIDNAANIEYGNTNAIPEPTNTIDLEEALDINLDAYYPYLY